MPVLETEKELEIYLMGKDVNPFGLTGKSFNQVEIKGYGVIDILNINIEPHPYSKPLLEITILELKKGKIDYNAIGQISRYKTAIDRLLSHWEVEEKFSVEEISGILIGETYTNGDVCFLGDNISWLTVYEYNIDFNYGIKFKESSGWRNTNEDLSKMPLFDAIKRDLAKSRFHSQIFRKARKEREKLEREHDFLVELEEYQVRQNINDGSQY